MKQSLKSVWIRDFTPVLGTTVYAFAAILSLYLIATAFGTLAYRRHRERGRVFLKSAIVYLFPLTCIVPLLLNDPRLGLKGFGILLAVAPFCATLGYLTPGLIDVWAEVDSRKAGLIYAVNIAGCVIGPLAASYWLLPYWGVRGGWVLLGILASAPALYFIERQNKTRRLAMAGVSACALATAGVFVRSYEDIDPTAVIRRDATATVASVGTGMSKRLLVNGIDITDLATATKIMGHLPAAVLSHPPRSACVICFGMGTTFRSLMQWGIPVTAVELVPSVVQAFGYYHADAASWLANSRADIVIDDGRRYLQRTHKTFDIVTIDPPPPVESAGSSLLYSCDFYRLLQQRLAPGGILQQWFPKGSPSETAAVTRSLKTVFPYVRVFVSIRGGLHYLASCAPIVLPPSKILRRRMPIAARNDLVEWETIPALSIFDIILKRELPTDVLMNKYPGVAITDDRPYNEYFVIRRTLAALRGEPS